MSINQNERDSKAQTKRNHSVRNDLVKAALHGRVAVARALDLFGPSNFIDLVHQMHNAGRAIVFNPAGASPWERGIVVHFVLRKLAQLEQSRPIRVVSLFLEDAQLYADRQNMVNFLIRNAVQSSASNQGELFQIRNCEIPPAKL